MLGPLDRRAVQAAGRREQILLNGEPVSAGVTLRTGDAVELLEPPDCWIRGARPPRLPVLLRRDDVLIGSKPCGLNFDTGRHGSAPAAVPLLREGASRPRPVHRLDTDTSGLVVLAMGREAEERLTAALREGRAHMHYVAVVRGRLPGPAGTIDVPLQHKSRSDAVLEADERHGREAHTEWAIREQLRGFTILDVVPRAGRSHQVRAHLASLGHPILCDAAYGEDDRLLLSQLKLHYRPKRGRPERPVLDRPALHAERFVWDAELDVTAPLPDDLVVLLNQLRRHRSVD